MKELRHYLSTVVRLWSIHHYRENLYKKTLSMHDLGSLRRVCSQGYTSSLLYKKEIQWVYDISKSTLYDGDIHEHVMTREMLTKNLSSDDKSLFIKKIINAEASTIQLYQSLLGEASLSYDAISILSDHLSKVRDIHLKLVKDVRNDYIPQQISHSYTVLA